MGNIQKSKIETALDKLHVIGEKIDLILHAVQEVNEPVHQTTSLPLEVPPTLQEEQPSLSYFPIPTEYRYTVDNILNKSFGLEVEPSSDSPTFKLSILVPERYSNMPVTQRVVPFIDRRPKVLSLAEGVNGVRGWAELVYKNLGPEAQARITADRIIP